jgi:ribonuclease D
VSQSTSPIASSLISTDAELMSACARWSTAGLIGVDTEFFRERTYYPRPALVQVADSDGVTLVDPLGLSELTPLRDLLVDPSVVKVMHAYGEDLDVFDVLTGATPSHVWDSQLAGAFAGHGFSLGYRSLVDALLGVALDKGETRSDWLRRPLSAAQLRYAVLDVAYLLPMHQRLSRELSALGRAAWLDEELEHQRQARAFDKQPEAAYMRVRGRGALTSEHHAALRALSRWRETEAMVRDVPRRHLVTDDVLMKMATLPATDVASLGKIQGLSSDDTSRYGQTILACIDTARAHGPGDSDAVVNMRPYAEVIKRLKAVTRRVSEVLNVPPELLANRRLIESLVVSVLRNGGDIPRELQGWRLDVITKPLLECLHEAS